MDDIKINTGVKSNKPDTKNPNKKSKSIPKLNKQSEQKSANKHKAPSYKSGIPHVEHRDGGTVLTPTSAGAVSGRIPKQKVDPKVVEKTIRQLEELEILNKDHNDSFIV